MDVNTIPYIFGIMATILIVLFIILEVPLMVGASIIGILLVGAIIVMLVCKVFNFETESNNTTKEVGSK